MKNDHNPIDDLSRRFSSMPRSASKYQTAKSKPYQGMNKNFGAYLFTFLVAGIVAALVAYFLIQRG